VLKRSEMPVLSGILLGNAMAMIAALLLAAACTSGGDREGTTGPDAASLRGGTLRLAVPDDSAGAIDLDPRSYSLESWGLARCCLLRTLYSYNGKPAEEGGAEVRPDLAEGMPEVSSDGLTWTFRLEAGLRYAPPSEDRTIIALDIVRALEREARVARPGQSSGDYNFYYSVIRGFDAYPEAADSIVGLETPDDRTLVVRLNEVTGDLAYRFSLPATAPIPDGASDGHDADYGRFLVASGPYMVEGSEDLDVSVPPEQQEPATGFVPARLDDAGVVEEPGSLVLVRNPSWKAEADRLRHAYPDRIELEIGGGDTEALGERVDTGEIDLVYAAFRSSPFEQVARYRADPDLEDQVFVNAIDTGWAVTMNLAVPPFDDLHVRRAVNLAIDEAALVARLSEPPHGEISAAEVGTHIAPDTFEAQLLGAFDPYPYDPAAAREEMRASTYDRTGDGVCDAPACRDVRALVLDFGVIPYQARMIRQDLAEVGIDLALDIVSWGDFFGDEGEHAGSIEDPAAHVPMGISYPWGKDYPEGTGWFLGLLDASGLGASNTSLVGASPRQLREWGYRGTSVPSIADRLEACQQRRGMARTQCWAELDQYLMTEVVPRVPYMFTESSLVVSERVVAYSFDQFAALPALDGIALAPGSE
jgi:peptide/nickel transport system substrate-binding protein